MNRLAEGLQFRREVAFENRWKIWHQYSRGEWADGILPVNLFFTMMRSIVPRVYFRNPSVSITSAKPGPLFMGFAKLLERVDSKLVRQMRLKEEMKRMAQDAFLYCNGIGTLGFGAEHEYAHEGYVQAPMLGKSGNAIEYRDHVVPNMPWFGRVHPRNYVVPYGCERMKTARWTAMFVERTLEDVRDDPRLSKKARQEVGPGYFARDEAERHKRKISQFSKDTMGQDIVQLAVIRDKKTRRVIVLAPGSSSNRGMTLYWGQDVLQGNGFPDFSLTFNPDTEYFWGVPDSQILEPYQLEINETRTQTMYHRRLSVIKFLVQKGMIDEGELGKMLSGDIGAMVQVAGNPNQVFQRMQAGDIPQALFTAYELAWKDVRETVGFSRNQFGEYNSRSGDTTATEANIVQQATEIRVDERRDAVADLMTDIFEGIHNLIFKKWTQQEIVEVVGPGGVPIWVQFSPAMLAAGQYNIKIDPDNSLPETKASREQKALQLYQVLSQNLIIDPLKLTQYLLHEMHGPAFDDLMRVMPEVGGGGQQMNALDFGGVIQESLGRADGRQMIDKLAGRLLPGQSEG